MVSAVTPSTTLHLRTYGKASCLVICYRTIIALWYKPPHRIITGLKAAIHQPQYFPYPGFFHKLSLADAFVIMDDVQYDKRFTNRNRIISTYGWTWISVPIKKEHKFLPNMLVEINNDLPWMAEHWRKIYTSYANARFFHLYRDYFENLYKCKSEFLFDLNFETLRKTIGWLGIRIETIRESELNVIGKGTQRLINVCKAIGADIYISGRGGAGYMDEKLFEKNGIRLEYQNYSPQPYPQRLSNSFIPDLSIIDMLANVGPDSLRVMTGEQPIELADGPVTQNSACATGR